MSATVEEVKEIYLRRFVDLHANDVTLAALRKMTPNELASLSEEVYLEDGPVTSEEGAALRVGGLFKKPPQFKEALRWIEVDLNPAFLSAVEAWRDEHAATFGFDPQKKTTENFPEIHETLLPHFNPADSDAIQYVADKMPEIPPFNFSSIVPLGPPGKENAWGLKADSPQTVELMKWMRNSRLDCQHPDYKEDWFGWQAVPGVPFEPMPHVTLVRNIKNFDISKPPPLGNLEGIWANLTLVRTRVGLIGLESGIKIKLVEDWHSSSCPCHVDKSAKVPKTE